MGLPRAWTGDPAADWNPLGHRPVTQPFPASWSCVGCTSSHIRAHWGASLPSSAFVPESSGAGRSPSFHIPSAQVKALARQPMKGHGDPDNEHIEKQAILEGKTESLTAWS